MLRHKKTITLLLLVILAGGAYFSSTYIDARRKLQPEVRASNRFAVKLFQQLAEESPQENMFFSPLCIDIGMSAVAAGAHGETEKQLLELLHLPGNSPAAHQRNALILDIINGDGSMRPYQLSMACHLWRQRGTETLDSYLAVARNQYGADMTQIDLQGNPFHACNEINNWITRNTNGLIDTVVEPEELRPDSTFVLTSAIYFHAKWLDPFPEDRTEEADFHVSHDETVRVQMMAHNCICGYLIGEKGGQYLRIPYRGQKVSMIVILPDCEMETFIRGLSDKIIANKIASMKSDFVDVYLPKFEIDTSLSLVPTFERMGLEKPFSGEADFSGIDGTKDIILSDVVHKTYVRVDEKGTEAAAAGGFVGYMGFEEEPPPEFRVDRPFIFLIRDNVTGAILFMGRVTNPLE